jgi:hypothetical protein
MYAASSSICVALKLEKSTRLGILKSRDPKANNAASHHVAAAVGSACPELCENLMRPWQMSHQTGRSASANSRDLKRAVIPARINQGRRSTESMTGLSGFQRELASAPMTKRSAVRKIDTTSSKVDIVFLDQVE